MRRLLRYQILYQTAALVGLVLVAKVGLHALGWEFIALSPLHASIVAGGIFILSILFAGVLPDFMAALALGRAPEKLASGWMVVAVSPPRGRGMAKSTSAHDSGVDQSELAGGERAAASSRSRWFMRRSASEFVSPSRVRAHRRRLPLAALVVVVLWVVIGP